MKTKFALISGITTGFLSLLILGHFAGISLHSSDFLLIISLLLTFIAITLLLTDVRKEGRCNRDPK